MPNFSLRTELLPTHGDLSTAHWSVDQQNQLSEVDRQRVALSFAFAAFASIRRCPGRELASDENLMRDNAGLGR